MEAAIGLGGHQDQLYYLVASTSLIGDIGDKSICGLDKKSWSFIQMHLVWPNTWFNFINVHFLAKISFIHLWKRLDPKNIWVICLPGKRLMNAKCYHQMLENQYFVNILGNWSAVTMFSTPKIAKNSQNDLFWAFWGILKMLLWVPQSTPI